VVQCSVLERFAKRLCIVLQSQTTFGIIKASSGGMLTFRRSLFSQDGVSACGYRFVSSFCRVNNTSQRYSRDNKIVAEDQNDDRLSTSSKVKPKSDGTLPMVQTGNTVHLRWNFAVCNSRHEGQSTRARMKRVSCRRRGKNRGSKGVYYPCKYNSTATFRQCQRQIKLAGGYR
jgi:hypothetical protein